MENVRRSVIITAILVWFLVFATADAEDHAKSPYWERIKSTINSLQVKYLPPDLDFRSIFSPSDQKKKTVTEAAAKSFQASKKTVEETARSAAGVVEEAAHVTAEKVKTGKTTDDDSHKSEL